MSKEEFPQNSEHVEYMKEAAHDLTHCGACASDLVQPIDWQEAGQRFWRLLLQCPDCEASGTVVVADELVDYYDAELKNGQTKLAKQLAKMVSDRIDQEVGSFADALARDDILPEDF